MVNGKMVQQQLVEFDVMKKSFMCDFQNWCECVVEFEIFLDEICEQYNNVFWSSNNWVQQKKMVFLECNLEQFMQVQRQLVEQNLVLKKEVVIVECKLIVCNERIQSLESLLQESQEKMVQVNYKCVFFIYDVVVVDDYCCVCIFKKQWLRMDMILVLVYNLFVRVMYILIIFVLLQI